MMIEHIIFDFGGVLLDLDPEATWSRLGSCLGITDINQRELQQILIEFEVGKYDEAVFVRKLQQLTNKEVESNNIIEAWNAMLGPLPSQRLDMLQELSKNYQIHLLSNTNETHVRYVYAYLRETYGIEDFGTQYFDSHYFSHILHLRKPNQDIYESVIAAIGTKAQKTIFIDDNKANITAACNYGINGVLHDPTEEIADRIYDYLAKQ